MTSRKTARAGECTTAVRFQRGRPNNLLAACRTSLHSVANTWTCTHADLRKRNQMPPRATVSVAPDWTHNPSVAGSIPAGPTTRPSRGIRERGRGNRYTDGEQDRRREKARGRRAGGAGGRRRQGASQPTDGHETGGSAVREPDRTAGDQTARPDGPVGGSKRCER